jgi:MoxR-like ATPase
VTEPRDALVAVREQVGKAVVGQDLVITGLLVALLVRGHVILEGVPGVAKTLMVKALARSLDLEFRRIQLAPDLMPSDVTGNVVYEGSTGEFRFRPGPVFTHLLLADEINRTPPKTQAALLEAMQEYHVTAAGKTYQLERPFFVLATQNPIELEGTYPLPEAQLDRFMFNILVTYLPEDHEVRVVTETTGAETVATRKVMGGSDILEFQQVVRQVIVSDEIARYAVRLAASSRPGMPGTPELVDKYVKWGAGLRASQSMILGGKARALIHGRHHVSIKDIQALAAPIMRHRIVTNFYAESEHLNPDAIVARLLESVPVPKSGLSV